MTTLTPEKEAELRRIQDAFAVWSARKSGVYMNVLGDDVSLLLDLLSTERQAREAAEKEVERLSQSPWITEAGFKDADDLIDMGRVGQSLIEAISDLRRSPGWEHWMPADGPAEIVFDLLNALADAEAANAALSALPPPVPTEEGGELKPCPFCQSPDPVMNPIKGPEHPHGLHDLHDAGPYYLHCDGCGADGPAADTDEAALVGWNTRPTQAPQDVAGLVATMQIAAYKLEHGDMRALCNGGGSFDLVESAGFGGNANAFFTSLLRQAVAALRASPISHEAIAWRYEAATAVYPASGRAANWVWRVADAQPELPKGWVRNLTPLYARPQAADNNHKALVETLKVLPSAWRLESLVGSSRAEKTAGRRAFTRCADHLERILAALQSPQEGKAS